MDSKISETLEGLEHLSTYFATNGSIKTKYKSRLVFSDMIRWLCENYIYNDGLLIKILLHLHHRVSVITYHCLIRDSVQVHGFRTISLERLDRSPRNFQRTSEVLSYSPLLLFSNIRYPRWPPAAILS